MTEGHRQTEKDAFLALLGGYGWKRVVRDKAVIIKACTKLS